MIKDLREELMIMFPDLDELQLLNLANQYRYMADICMEELSRRAEKVSA